MSTATNGAATEAAFTAITKAMKNPGTAVVDATASIWPAPIWPAPIWPASIWPASIWPASIWPASIGSASVGPAMANASDSATESGQVWLKASKTISGLSLDAYDASVRAFLDYTESVAAASNAPWAIELTQGGTKLVSEIATNYSNAARALFNK